MIIGIHGTRQVGKDSLFNQLHKIDFRYQRYSYADALKEDMAEFIYKSFGWDIFTISGEKKEIIRPIMIAYGCAKREIDVNYWPKVVEKQIKRDARKMDSLYIPVITDNRFESEIDYMKSVFGDKFLLVDVTRKGAPEPTEEEKKHFKKIAARADIKFSWGNDTIESMACKAQVLLDAINGRN